MQAKQAHVLLQVRITTSLEPCNFRLLAVSKPFVRFAERAVFYR